jgi:O-antigen ligase
VSVRTPETTSRRVDAVAFLTWFIASLFAIPAIYVFSPLGGLGAPAVLFGWAAFAWWAVAWMFPGSGVNTERQPIRIAMFAVFATILISYAVSNQGPVPPAQARAADRGILYMLAMLGICLLVADGVDTFARLRTLLERLVLAAGLIAVLGIIQYELKLDFVTSVFDTLSPLLSRTGQVAFAGGDNSFTSIRRVAGTAVHPIEFAVVLAMALPLAAHFALLDRVRTGWRRWWKIFAIAIAELMAQSRSGIFSAFIAFLILVPAWPVFIRRKLYRWAIPAVLAARLAFPGLIGTIRNLFLGFQSDPSYKSRTEDYAKIPDLVKHHPWFGRGFQTFLPKDFFYLDNQFLMSLIETGFIGLLVFIAALATGITLANQARRWAITDEERLLAQALLAGVAGVTAAFATFDFFSFQIATGTFFLLLGSCGAIWRILRAQALASGKERPAKPRKVTTLPPQLPRRSRRHAPIG